MYHHLLCCVSVQDTEGGFGWSWADLSAMLWKRRARWHETCVVDTQQSAACILPQCRRRQVLVSFAYHIHTLQFNGHFSREPGNSITG